MSAEHALPCFETASLPAQPHGAAEIANRLDRQYGSNRVKDGYRDRDPNHGPSDSKHHTQL